MKHKDLQGSMSRASDNERTAMVKGTRRSERLVSPFDGSERLMTLLEVSQLLCVPVATLYRWRYRGEVRQATELDVMFDTGGPLWRRDAGRSAARLVVRVVGDRKTSGRRASGQRAVQQVSDHSEWNHQTLGFPRRSER